MATFALIPGGGCTPWYWNLLEVELRRAGHATVAVELPVDAAGLADYAAAAVQQIQHGRVPGDLVVVAHSLGGFTGPLVCDRLPVDLLVLLTAMVPRPGETANDWWTNTGYQQASREHLARVAAARGGAEVDVFYDDVPPDLTAAAMATEVEQSEAPMADPWPLSAWPAVRTEAVLCRDDHLFPPEFMRSVVRERLGFEPAEIAGGHMVMLSRPAELAATLIRLLG